MPAIGILGGSFNPPHLGHVALARHALRELSLDSVALMPLHTPPHKPAERDPGPEHRLAMCRLAVAEEPGVSACALEVRRPGPSYTAVTLQEIHDRDPEAELTFIVGADTARTVPSWHEPQRVLALASLAVARRPGTGGEDVLAALAQIPSGEPGHPLEVRFLAMSPMDVSSSLARDRLSAGQPVEDLLDAAVSGYVAEHGLYRAPPGARDD